MKQKDKHSTEQILAEKNQLKDIAWALKKGLALACAVGSPLDSYSGKQGWA